MAALQHLPAIQRAALILRDVLGFSAAEVAGQLDRSTASVNSALQRARKVIDSTAPTRKKVLRDLGDVVVTAIVTRWVEAWHAGDVDTIVTMLADDARYSMPPLPEWYQGLTTSGLPARGPLQSRWRFLPTTANGQLALAPTCGMRPTGIRTWRARRPHHPRRPRRRGDGLPHRRPHPVRTTGPIGSWTDKAAGADADRAAVMTARIDALDGSLGSSG